MPKKADGSPDESLSAKEGTPPDATGPDATVSDGTAPDAAPPDATESVAGSEDAAELVELKHQDTSFFDEETGFSIARDQQIPLGKTVGKATMTAISGGRLIRVKTPE